MSVVVPTFNRAATISRIVEPLLADAATSEVIVVVDGSRDGTLEQLEALADSDARLKPVWQPNAGEGAARQTGLQRATGDVVLFVDDDVRAAPELVSAHAALHRNQPDRVVLGYMPPARARDDDPDGFSVELYAEAYEARCRMYDADPGAILRHLWAGNLSLRRDTALAVGLTSEEYTERYHPDREFGLRLLRAETTGVFSRSLRATHHYERSLPAFLRDARSQGAGEVLLHRMYAPELGALPADRFERHAPPAVAALIRLTRRPRAAAWSRATLVAGIRLAGRLRWRRAQLAAARTVRRIEQQQGALDQVAGRR